MRKVLHVALRELLATVATKGFIIGVLLTPLLVGLTIIVLPLLLRAQAPRIAGEVALIDRSGEVGASFAAYLTPEAMTKRRARLPAEVLARAQRTAQDLTAESSTAAAGTLEALGGDVPQLEVAILPPTSDLESEKQRLLADQAATGDSRPDPSPPSPRLALIVVHDDAVAAASGAPRLGSYDLFIRERLDDRLIDELRGGMQEAIVDARLRRAGLDRPTISTLTRVERVPSVTVTDRGERQTNEALNILLPMGFMLLLLLSVMTSGQYIMTTTIEEKSSRVVEVLLAAVSPLQLMAGKILGQLGVGLLVLLLYSGVGIASLLSFALFGLVDLHLLFYLLVFYLISYFVIGSLMAAVGAAVNELREAQTLMTPIMLLLMIPWILWLPITRNPSSLFSVVISFLPPVNSFAMLLRMTSTQPPPLWQVWLSISIGVGSAFAAVWFAAKVFRIGLLMYGKPPNLRTLARWARMA
jgi:ABC-type Na+ efflux pump permease subunit